MDLNWKITNADDFKTNLVYLINGKNYPLYSKRDPESSGRLYFRQNFRGKGIYIFIGAGLLYHVIPFILNTDVERVIILEPDVDLVDELKKTEVYKKVEHLENRKYELIAGSKSVEAYISSVKTRYDYLLSNGIYVLGYPGIIKFSSNKYNYKLYLDRVSLEINRLFNDSLTIARFARRWILNFRKNLPLLKNSCEINLLKKTHSGSCMVAAAGPSLTNFVNIIKNIESETVLIAVDAAVRPLIFSGVIPDYIVIMDPQPYGRYHFAGIENRVSSIPVIVSPFVYWNNLKLFKKRYLYVNYHPLSEFFDIDYDYFDFNYLSVATLAVRLAVYMGFNNIYLAGFDYAFTGFRSYAKDSFMQRFQIASSSRVHSLLSMDISYISKSMGRNSKVLTSPVLKGYKEEFELLNDNFKNKDVKIKRFGGGELKLRGVQDITDVTSNLEQTATKISKYYDNCFNLKVKTDDQRIIYNKTYQSLVFYYHFMKKLDIKTSQKKAGEFLHSVFSEIIEELNALVDKV